MQHTKCHTDVGSVELPLAFSVELKTSVCLKGHVWNIIVLHVIQLIYVRCLSGLNVLVLSDIKWLKCTKIYYIYNISFKLCSRMSVIGNRFFAKYPISSHDSSMGGWMPMSANPPLWSRLKNLNYWRDCQYILYSHLWSPEEYCGSLTLNLGHIDEVSVTSPTGFRRATVKQCLTPPNSWLIQK